MRCSSMDNNDDVGFWDSPKASWFAEISLIFLLRVSPTVAGRSLKLLSWQDNKYSARVLSLPPLLKARQEKEFKCHEWSILDFTMEEGIITHVFSCECRGHTLISHIFFLQMLFTLFTGKVSRWTQSIQI